MLAWCVYFSCTMFGTHPIAQWSGTGSADDARDGPLDPIIPHLLDHFEHVGIGIPARGPSAHLQIRVPVPVLQHFARGANYCFWNEERPFVISHSYVFMLMLLVSVGMNFGILLAWVAISCVTLPVFQWWMRRKIVLVEAQPSAEQKT